MAKVDKYAYSIECTFKFIVEIGLTDGESPCCQYHKFRLFTLRQLPSPLLNLFDFKPIGEISGFNPKLGKRQPTKRIQSN